MKMEDVIFKEYDIRGVYETQFDCDFAYELGRAHIKFINETKNIENPTVTVGHDARLSSPDISKSLCKGMVDSGANVIFLGLITTPISYYSTFTLDNVCGGIMITGSHNPPDYNGFKISVGKTTIYGDDIQRLKEIIKTQDYISAQGSMKEHDIFPDYVSRYQQEFKGIQSVPFVLDCGNGAAGCIARRMYEACGLKPDILFEEPDGRFPNHHPDPTVEENLQDLAKRVKETGAKVGIGFDGDSDRIGIVDDQGKMILGDELMAIFSRDILQNYPGKKIIGDVKCSDRLYADIKNSGGDPVMWMTGHSLIKSKVKEEGSPFGGELSGHIFIADRNFGYDDALYAGLRLIEILGKTGKTISQLLEGFGEAYNTPEIRIDTTEEKKHAVVNHLKEIYDKPSDDYTLNLIDGIRISFKDGWALARSSNTQPVLVLRFEASTPEGLKRIQSEIESKVNEVL